MQTRKRLLSLLLCGAMLLSLCSPTVFAEAQTARDSLQTIETSGLCEHHTKHTEDCGYSEGKPGMSCTHVCSVESGCITEELNCQHKHDSECGYTPAIEESPCDFVCDACALQYDDVPTPPGDCGGVRLQPPLHQRNSQCRLSCLQRGEC